MKKQLVLTLAGHDRIGVVEEVTKEILPFSGNVDASRMARLGGEFAMLMLISVPEERFGEFSQCIASLQNKGYAVTSCETQEDDSEEYDDWNMFQIEVFGADHEGIIHQITSRLAELKISVENMDSSMSPAPLSGSPLFMMLATVFAPPEFTMESLQGEMDEIGAAISVD
ncbi:transcriptional regulator, partial [bacterium]|nr:transcriptional regulator [bacterium]